MENNFLNIYNKAIRIITVAPLMALLTLLIIYFSNPSLFGGVHNLIFSILFLVLLPLLSYPLSYLIPKIKSMGREGQRNLAILTSVIGYVCSIIYSAFTKATKTLWIIFLTYFISGILIVIFNKLIKFRASGHACGIMGPVCMVTYFLGPIAFFVGILIFVLTMISSIIMKRHTFSQFITGGLISAMSLIISAFIIKIF